MAGYVVFFWITIVYGSAVPVSMRAALPLANGKKITPTVTSGFLVL